MKYNSIVEQVLEKYPKTRDDDFLLYAAVCRGMGIDIYKTTIADLAGKHKELKAPSFAGVVRARRMLQEKRIDLVGNSYSFRKESAEEFKQMLGKE